MLLNVCRSISSIQRLQTVYQSFVKNTKCRNYIFRKSFHASPKCSFNIKSTRYNVDAFQIAVNTNVQNNVILYKNENKSDFIILKTIGYLWIIVHIVLIGCTYSPKYMETWYKTNTWFEYVKLQGLNFLYFVYSATIGIGSSAFFYLVNQRIIRYVVLHKGGKKVSIITNHFYKVNRVITLPVDEVKTKISREHMKNFLPIKIKGHHWYYLLDSEGTFLNKRLFDYTVGKSKVW